MDLVQLGSKINYQSILIMIFIGIIISFFLYTYSCSPNCSSTWNQIQLQNGYILHLHHWFLSALVFPFVTNTYIQGLLIGGILHGILTYDDWNVLFYKYITRTRVPLQLA